MQNGTRSILWGAAALAVGGLGYWRLGAASPAKEPKHEDAIDEIAASPNPKSGRGTNYSVDLGDDSFPGGIIIEVDGAHTKTRSSGVPKSGGKVIYYSAEELTRRVHRALERLCSAAEANELARDPAAYPKMTIIFSRYLPVGGLQPELPYRVNNEFRVRKFPSRDARIDKLSKGIVDGVISPGDIFKGRSVKFTPPPGFTLVLRGKHAWQAAGSGSYRNRTIPDTKYADELNKSILKLLKADKGDRPPRADFLQDVAPTYGSGAPATGTVPAVTTVDVQGPATKWSIQIPTGPSATMAEVDRVLEQNKRKTLSELQSLNRVPPPKP